MKNRKLIWVGITLTVMIIFMIMNPPAHEVAGNDTVERVADHAIIPAPVSVEVSPMDTFRLEQGIQIGYEEGLEGVAMLLAGQLESRFGLKSVPTPESEAEGVRIRLRDDSPHIVGRHKESYTLQAEGMMIVIGSMTGAGSMHGTQTLLQLIRQDTVSHYVLYHEIYDEPRFPHRGMLLDCSRHFFSVDVVKKYIDLLAYYKMNTLHWHITEDQGWRIEIEKYPNLITVGSLRQDGMRAYGGYYSQDDVREIVAYAEERYITIIPEIEMPGHSQAAIASYPHLSCTGERVQVANEWGVFKEIYCAGNDEVFVFIKDVLDEVIELFPSEYIHIGGDEAPKARWEECPKCQQRIQDEGLADEQELQSWFIKEIEAYLAENGKTLIGWDEILEGGLAESAVVQSWRGMEGGIEAVKHGNRVIMSPTSHCYFDYGLDATDLEEVYSFDPIPEGITEEEAELIIGGECNLWSEHIPTEKNLDSKVFPRMLAMAEVLWSYPKERDYEEFYGRARHHMEQLQADGVNVGFEAVPVAYETMIRSGELWVTASSSIPGIELKTDVLSDPNSEPIEMDLSQGVLLTGEHVLRTTVVRNGEDVTGEYHLHVDGHRALGAPYSVDTTYNEWYSGGGDSALTDGVLGSINFRDGRWQGYWGGLKFKVTIDLGELKEVSYIGSNFYHYPNAWILSPKIVIIEYSEDGDEWHHWWKGAGKLTPEDAVQEIDPVFWVDDETMMRYVRFIVYNGDDMPDWHDAAGEPSWIFIDEISVR